MHLWFFTLSENKSSHERLESDLERYDFMRQVVFWVELSPYFRERLKYFCCPQNVYWKGEKMSAQQNPSVYVSLIMNGLFYFNEDF